MKRFLAIIGIALVLAACGVKSDLMRPNGQPNPPDREDPSKPPQPIGR